MRVARSRRAVAAFAALAVALGSLAAGCRGAPDRAAAAGTAPAPERVRVAVMPFLSYAPIFIGADEEIFAAHGIDLELVQLSSTESSAALAQGEVDVIANFLSAGLFNLIGRGNRVRIVADKGWIDPGHCAANGILARRELAASGELETAGGLRGRTIHVRPGSVEELVVDRVLGSAGLAPDDLVERDVPAPAKLEALAGGALDLACWSEPYLTVAEDSGDAVMWRRVADVTPEQQWGVILFGRSLLDERPEVGRRFMAAYLEAVARYAEGKTDDNVASLVRHTQLDADLVRRACWQGVRRDGTIDVASVLAFERWAVSRGYLDRVLTADEFWDPRFVTAARSDGGNTP